MLMQQDRAYKEEQTSVEIEKIRLEQIKARAEALKEAGFQTGTHGGPLFQVMPAPTAGISPAMIGAAIFGAFMLAKKRRRTR
jgi:hypothetical protein